MIQYLISIQGSIRVLRYSLNLLLLVQELSQADLFVL